MTHLIQRDPLDPSRTNWLNLVPSLSGKKILKFGTNNFHTIKALDRIKSRSITFAGRISEHIRTSSKVHICDESKLKRNYYDICIVDESDCFVSKPHSIKHLIKKCHGYLNKDGIILVAVEKGFRNIKSRIDLWSFYRETKYKTEQYFLIAPSLSEPYTIYPVHQSIRPVNKILFREIFLKQDFKSAAKAVLKYLLSAFTGKFNPMFGMIVVAGKNNNNILEFEEIIKNKLDPDPKDPIYTIWSAKPYTGKQVGLVFHRVKDNDKVKAVVKKSNFKYHRDFAIRQEYENLLVLSSHSAFFTANNIKIPEPIFFIDQNNCNISIESAVPGTPLSSININSKGNSDILQKKLVEIAALQIVMQKYLSKNAKEFLPRLPKDYFENRLFMDFEYFNDLSRLKGYYNHVQHGDLTDVNLFFTSSNKWSVIDWEWLASGFPQLFDLYHLFFSVKYRNFPERVSNNLLTHYFNSFVDTFFDENKFSRLMGRLVIQYCHEFSLPRDMVFNLFMDFLLFIYNKYRIDYQLIEYANLHSRMIHFAFESKEKFFFKPGLAN